MTLQIDPASAAPALVLTPAAATDRPGRDEVISAYRRSGLLLLRGFELDKDAFIRLTTEVTPEFMDYRGGAYARDKIDGDETVLSVTGNKQFFAVPFHGEMYYTDEHPAVMWFYCSQPPRDGGETTVCDGTAVYAGLSDATRRKFESTRIKYIRRYENGLWQKIYATEDADAAHRFLKERHTRSEYHREDGSLSTEYTCSAIATTAHGGHKTFINNILPVLEQEARGLKQSLVRFEDGSVIPAEIAAEVTALSKTLTLAVKWRRHDLLMIDNSRFMHGRNAFADTERQIFVRMAKTQFR